MASNNEVTAAQSLHSNPPNEYQEKDTIDVVLAKAIGLKDDDNNEIYDCKAEPFLSARTKSKWKPSHEVLIHEVHRRYNADDMKPSSRAPGKNWNCNKCIQWLKDYPITDHEQIDQIRAEVALLKEDLIKDKNTEIANTQLQWRTENVYLRLIHCLLEDDEIRGAYACSFDALDRYELKYRRRMSIRR
jgi:hypothetical protein